MISEVYLNLFKIRWENHNDPLILMSILEQAHKDLCGYTQEDLLTFRSIRDTRIGTNLSKDTISTRTRKLDESDYPLSISSKGGSSPEVSVISSKAGSPSTDP